MLAMVCMVVVPVGLLGALGWFAARNHLGWAGALAGVAVGLVVAGIAIKFTFYEGSYPAPTLLVFEAAPGFSHGWVVLVEDPSVSAEIPWTEGEGSRGLLTVPAGGVVRVRSLERLAQEYPDATLSGEPAVGRASKPAFPELGATSVWMYRFEVPGGQGDLDIGGMEGDEFVARVRVLEAER